ncbi:DUF6491 family protein [Brevundimonas sp. FT23028]|uniref:DUF6491 family protein n=1 Tax=Brevundimonas sp. FT23028 TaxID=3393748 RepID=UPI003B58B12E
MRMPVLACVGASAALMIASCAPTASTDGASATPRARECFSVQQVTNFRQGRSNEVYLRVGRDDVYELSAAGGCRDLDFANRMAILPDFGGVGGSRLCTTDWARLVVPGSTSAAEVCRVRISRKLTAEEIAALPGAYRP